MNCILLYLFQFSKFPPWYLREWRGGLQAGLSSNPQPIHDPLPSPTTSGRKRQKTSQSVPALPAPPPAIHPQQLATTTQPSSSTARKAVPPGTKGKKLKPVSR